MKSRIDEVTERAFHHALNFFQSNDRSVDNQRLCIQQIMDITGFDFDTCLEIQNPVLDLYMAIDTMNIGQSIIESNIRTVTQTISNHISNAQIAQSFSSHQPSHQTKSPHNYSQATNDEVDGHFVYAYDSSDGRLDMNGFFEKGNWVVRRTVEHLDYLTQSKDRHVLSEKKHLNFSFNLMNDESVSYLARFLHWQELNLLQLNLGYNSISDQGITPLFYNLRNAPDVRTHNIQYINLSDNNIGDYGADYISQSLISGRYPNLRCLDVSGNQITTNGGALFIEAMKARPNQEIVIKTHDNTSSKTTWQYLKQAFNYFADNHHKENAETDKKWVGLYGDDEWAVCRKYLQTSSVVIAGGFIAKSVDSKFLLLSSKIPHKYAKILGFGGLFLQIVKDNYKDLITNDLLQCIAVINSKSLIDIKDYTTEMIGSTSDDFIFE